MPSCRRGPTRGCKENCSPYYFISLQPSGRWDEIKFAVASEEDLARIAVPLVLACNKVSLISLQQGLYYFSDWLSCAGSFFELLRRAFVDGWRPELQALAASRSQFYQQANENGMVKQVRHICPEERQRTIVATSPVHRRTRTVQNLCASLAPFCCRLLDALLSGPVQSCFSGISRGWDCCPVTNPNPPFYSVF